MNARPVSPRALARQSGASSRRGLRKAARTPPRGTSIPQQLWAPQINRDHESPVLPPRDPEVPLTFFFEENYSPLKPYICRETSPPGDMKSMPQFKRNCRTFCRLWS